MSVGDGAFAVIAGLLASRAGVVIPREKSYLLDNRLSAVARRQGLPNVDALGTRLASWPSEALSVEIVEAMLNHETYFFRDTSPFAQLKEAMLPALRQARGHAPIRIWSAACATGQEPYSIAMTLADDPELVRLPVEIVATDLSHAALARAETGLYSQFEVQRGLPIRGLVAHFAQEGEQWRLNADIRRRVRFRQINLCAGFAGLGRFDIIFCRNVLMYFGAATKTEILHGMAATLAPDGFLVLGAAETVFGATEAFAPDWVNRGLYRRVEAATTVHRAYNSTRG